MALHAKAKAEPGFRFYALYDKISREDFLVHAWAQCRSNKGAPGMDGQDFADVEAYGVQRWLGELALALRQEEYRPDPIRRVFIPKANSTAKSPKLRPLGISTLRDRVCMTAAMLVLEPIFAHRRAAALREPHARDREAPVHSRRDAEALVRRLEHGVNLQARLRHPQGDPCGSAGVGIAARMGSGDLRGAERSHRADQAPLRRGPRAARCSVFRRTADVMTGEFLPEVVCGVDSEPQAGAIACERV